MGLFKRKPPPVAPPPPVELMPGDEEKARLVVQAHLAAVGNDRMIRSTGLALAQAGGAPADMMAAYRSGGGAALDRPWRWLAAVAARTEDTHLVAEIALLFNFWDTQLRDRIGLADSMDMMLSPPPDAIVTEIYSTAVTALGASAWNRLVVRNATGDVTVLGLLTSIATVVRNDAARFTPEVYATAQQILARTA